MLIYNYDKDTKEYIKSTQADKDPEQTKNQGEFIPLIPADETIIEPPITGENEVAVFNIKQNKWEVKKDYRKNFCLIDKNMNVKEINSIGLQSGCIVTKEFALEINANKDKYKFVDNTVVEKTDEEYQAEINLKEEQRISSLSLTKREVLLALYDDKGITPESVEQMLDEREKIEFKFADAYFRGNPLIDKIGIQFGYSKKELDYLFENKQLQKKKEQVK